MTKYKIGPNLEFFILNVEKLQWVPEVLHYSPLTPMILVGLKTDLRDDPDELQRLRRIRERAIEYEEGKAFAEKIGAVNYLECSAITHQTFIIDNYQYFALF